MVFWKHKQRKEENYENANDILPKDLLEQVQKIAGGRLLYIPIAGDKKLWGEKTGNRFRVK